MAWIEIDGTRVANMDNVIHMTVRQLKRNQPRYVLEVKYTDGTCSTIAIADNAETLQELMRTIAGLARGNALIKRSDIRRIKEDAQRIG